jgi:lipopolysaccharide export system permease protein
VNVWAEQGTQETDPANGMQYLVLSNGKRYEMGARGMDMRTMEFSQLRQRLEMTEQRRDRVRVETLPLSELGDHPKARAEWHWRLALPLYAAIGGLMAVGISRVPPRQGRFAKVVPGSLLMFVYYMSLLVNRNAIGEGQVPDIMGLWLVHAVFAAIAVFLLRNLARPVAAR